VGQAAVDMAFQTEIRFPEIFVLDRIYGENPLYVYTIDLSDVLTQTEIAADVLQKDYQFEGEELKAKFIEYNVGSDNILEIFAAMDANNRSIKLLDLIRMLKRSGITIGNTVTFLKSLSIDDQLITRIISSVGGDTG
jgi:hypothetical protein